MPSNSPEQVTPTERGERVSETTSIRCAGCNTTRNWADFNAPPESADAIATCPTCGTHILAIETVTERDVAELSEFFEDITRRVA
jgi:DNA-directed RNA polymerase subunit RPC12/RpoP